MDKTVSTRVADDTYERIEDYADQHGMTRSEATRALIRDSLDRADWIPGPQASYGAVLGSFGLIFIAAQYADASGITGPLGIALLAGGLLHDIAHATGLTDYSPLRDN